MRNGIPTEKGSFPSDPMLDAYNREQILKRTLQRATEEIRRLKQENETLRNIIKEQQNDTTRTTD